MKSLSTQPRQRVTTSFCYLAIVLVICAASQTIKAQTCDNIPQGGSESLTAWITNRDTGAPLNGQGIVPVNTYIRIDAIATAFGQCLGMGWNCQVSPCECVNTGTYERTVSMITVNADMSTSGTLNGNYFIGNVYGKNPDGTTADWHVLSTEASDSSGPLYAYLAYPGTYQFQIKAIINTTPCNMQPGTTDTIFITLYVGANDRAVNNGADSCESGGGTSAAPTDVGRPINVTNGNMYIQQTDYRLPGVGEGLEITRTYNSANQTAGLFGYGWSSILDESIVAYGQKLLRLNLPDGRAVYLARPTTADTTYTPKQPLNFYGQIVKNGDNTYTLTFKDGRVHQFNTNGRLVSFVDRNGNATTLTLNASGNPTTITDPSGRTVTFTYDSYTKIATMSDSMGTIATYAHAFWNRLTSVTYADGSNTCSPTCSRAIMSISPR